LKNIYFPASLSNPGGEEKMVASSDKKNKKKSIAEESLKTKKAREKLLKRMETVDAKITKEALDRKSLEIQRWISRHADRRVVLKDKSISLFDENQNTAEFSQKVTKILEKFREERLT
jgi:hypothetical protein